MSVTRAKSVASDAPTYEVSVRSTLPMDKEWPASLRAEPILDLAIDGHCAGRKRARRDRAKAHECSGAARQFHRSIPLVINADNKSAMKKSNRDWRNDLQAAPERLARLGRPSR